MDALGRSEYKVAVDGKYNLAGRGNYKLIPNGEGSLGGRGNDVWLTNGTMRKSTPEPSSLAAAIVAGFLLMPRRRQRH